MKGIKEVKEENSDKNIKDLPEVEKEKRDQTFKSENTMNIKDLTSFLEQNPE